MVEAIRITASMFGVGIPHLRPIDDQGANPDNHPRLRRPAGIQQRHRLHLSNHLQFGEIVKFQHGTLGVPICFTIIDILTL